MLRRWALPLALALQLNSCSPAPTEFRVGKKTYLLSNSDAGIVQDAHIRTTSDCGARTINFRELRVSYQTFEGRTLDFRAVPDVEHEEMRAVAEAALETLRKRRQDWTAHTALEKRHEYAFKVYLSNKWRL